MKRRRKKNEQTRALQKVAPVDKPSDCKTVDNHREALRIRLCRDVEKVTGTGPEVAHVLVGQLACTLAYPDYRTDKDGTLIRAISILAEYAPQGIIETQLVAQMVATHEAGM